MNEIAQNKNVILFIDELHTLVGAGAAEGAIDASNMLKPALARGELQCVGASTLNEYRKYIEKDGALERRFQTVIVDPPTIDETIEILKGLRQRYEDHHRVIIPDETLDGCGPPRRALHHRPVPAGQGDRRHRRGRRPARGWRRRCRPPRSAELKERPRAGQPGQGRGGPRSELRAGRGAAGPRARAPERDPPAPGGVGEGAPDAPPGHRRGGDRVHRLPLDRHSRHPAAGGRDHPPAADGGGAPRVGRGPGRGHRGHCPGHPPLAGPA